PSFARQIAPLLRQRCLNCHAARQGGSAGPRGDLALTSRSSLLAGGATGPAVEPGRASASLLFQYVRDKKMPPRPPPTSREVELRRRWIDSGAKWEGRPLQPVKVAAGGRAGRDWWSLQPIRRPAVPGVRERARVRTPIDAFLLSALEAKGLSFAPEADKATL